MRGEEGGRLGILSQYFCPSFQNKELW